MQTSPLQRGYLYYAQSYVNGQTDCANPTPPALEVHPSCDLSASGRSGGSMLVSLSLAVSW